MQYILLEDSVVVVLDNKTHTISKDNTHFNKVVDAIKAGDEDDLRICIDLASEINTFGEGRITVRDGFVFFHDEVMNNALTDRILRMIKDGFNVQPMLRFMDNLMDNPSSRAVNELYRFLESNKLPLTDDGCFLAYKNVKEDFYDRHSGTFRNQVGDVCEMPRNKVMDDPNKTCSAGLHFCSIEYLNTGWTHEGHTMIVKINPRDVVSIPVDYNNSKGRCCRYEVIGEHMDRERDTLSDKSVYESSYDESDALAEEYNDGYEHGYHDAVSGRCKISYRTNEEGYMSTYADGYEDGWSEGVNDTL